MKLSYSRTLLSALTLSFAFSGFASPLSDQIAGLKNDFTGDLYQVKKAVNQLEWTGIADESLFDQIAQRLESNKADVSKPGAELNAELVTALGLSGLSKYDAVLQQYEQDTSLKKLSKFSHSAREKLIVFSSANPIISKNNESATTTKELDRIRALNMIKSSNARLIERGARVVSENFQQDDELIKAAYDTLVGMYKTAKTSDETDAAAWLCKIVGRSKKPEFTAILTTIAEDKSVASNIVKYAKKDYAAGQ